MRLAPAVAIAACIALAGCAAPRDDDGEPVPPGVLAAAPAKVETAAPVVVDTDLGGDDLVALTYLLRHPSVDVQAVTIAATGLAACPAGVDVVADLLTVLEADPVPVACGRSERGPGGHAFPTTWRMTALAGSGLPRDLGSMRAVEEPAPQVIGSLAASAGGALHVIALGPLSNLADLATSDPQSFEQLAGVHAMAGVVDGPGQDDVGEWNAAADPEAVATVLRGPVPLTLVTAEVVPGGTPEALRAPVVGHVVLAARVPAWWDLAAAAAFTEPTAVSAIETGRWQLDDAEPGRLRRAGDGGVRVVRELDAAALERAYEDVFAMTQPS